MKLPPLVEIRRLIMQKSGLTCDNHYQIGQLQELVYQETGNRLSTQTLKRFFGLIKTQSLPDQHTLNTLARYLQFTSYPDLTTFLQTSPAITQQATNIDAQAATILHIIQDIRPVHLQEPGLLQLVRNLFKLFDLNPAIPEVAYPQLAASEFGRHYFFEQFVNIDALAKHYGKGMEVYLQYEQELELRLFAYSILCFRSFLIMDDVAFDYYYQKTQTYVLEEVKGYHPFILGRYFACQVYYHYLTQSAVGAIIEDVLVFLNGYVPVSDDNYQGFPCAELIVAESLVLTGHYQQAYELLLQDRAKHFEQPPYMDKGYITQLNIWRLLAGYQAEMISATQFQKELKRLSVEPLYFLSRQYYNVIMKVYAVRGQESYGIQVLKHLQGQIQGLKFTRLQEMLSR